MPSPHEEQALQTNLLRQDFETHEDDTDLHSGGGGGGSHGDLTDLEVNDHPQYDGYPDSITPAEITVSQNNYSPAGIATADRVRISSDINGYNITGISASQIDGRVLFLDNVNTTGEGFIIPFEDPASAAANRILGPYGADGTGGGAWLMPGGSMQLIYDGTSSRWRMVGTDGMTVSDDVTEVKPVDYIYFPSADFTVTDEGDGTITVESTGGGGGDTLEVTWAGNVE